MICVACGQTGIRSVAVLKDHRCSVKEDWIRVAELKRQGKGESADRLARRLLGVKGEPMDEDTKEKLRRWKEEHAQEIKDREELKRNARKRLKLLTAPARSFRRKNG